MNELSKPAFMQAIRCLDSGPPVRFDVARVPRPEVQPGHVRVDVACCGFGAPDMLLLSGKYQVRPSVPFIPGSEVAGIVTDVGPGVRGVQVGARVAGLNFTFVGGLAEVAILPVAPMVQVPANVPLQVAATMLVNYSTAYYAFKDRGNLKPGERVLVLGAAGGVGLAAVELAKAMGAHVLAAASTDEKLAMARRHGADDVLNYTREPLKDALKSYGGVDVVVDPVGGGYTELALRALHPGGRLLVIGFAAGEIPRIPLNLALLKDCSIVGVFLGAQTRDKPANYIANMKDLYGWYSQGRLKPVISEFDCFTEFGTVMHRLHERQVLGTAVLNVARASRAVGGHAELAETLS